MEMARRRVLGVVGALVGGVLLAALVPLAASSPVSASAGGAGRGPRPAHVPAGEAPNPDVIHFRGLSFDGTKGQPTAPARLSQQRSSEAQLWLVQFTDAPRPAALKALTGAGAEIVQYQPSNAYVVRVTGSELGAVEAMRGKGLVQFTGPYHPQYRLEPSLQGTGKDGPATNAAGRVPVTVQLVTGPRTAATLEAIAGMGTIIGEPNRVLGYTNVRVDADPAKLADLARLPDAFNVEPYVEPTKNDEVQNQIVAGNVVTASGSVVPTGTGYLAWLASKGFPTTPASYPIVNVVDDGVDNGTTTPLDPTLTEAGAGTTSRLLSAENCTISPSAHGLDGHGHINANIVGGHDERTGSPFEDAGGYQRGQGVNPFTRLAYTKIFRDNYGPFDLSACGGNLIETMRRAYVNGARVASHSWGANVGGAYTTDAQAFDVITRDADPVTAGNQELFNVFAAGNAGSGANTIGSPGTAKNVLTVGATENVREEGVPDGCNLTASNSADDLASFSSRGPTDDQRIKPDIVAPGMHIQGTASPEPGFTGLSVCGDPNATADPRYHPQGQTTYTWSSGTSHSTPAVSGAASLVHEYYGRVLDVGADPSPAMLKALLVHTPRYLNGVATGGNLPSNTQGYGDAQLGPLFDSTVPRVVHDQDVLLTSSGQAITRTYDVVDSGDPIAVTLAWTDAPGSTTGNSFVNNLDLVVQAGGNTYLGNVFAGGASATGGSADVRNNVENVFLPAGISGPVTVLVSGTTIAGNGVPGNASALDQDFALVVSNVENEAAGTLLLNDGVVADDSTGDNDGRVEQNETIRLTLPIRSSDVASPTATGVTATLAVLGGAATVTQDTSAYPDIDGGASQANTTPYVLDIGAHPCGTAILLQQTVTSSAGTTVFNLSLPVGAPTNHASTDVPKNIVDVATIESDLTVTDPSTIADLDVRLTLTHTFDGDLDVFLVAPDATLIELSTDNGGSGDNFNGTVFDDEATTAITAGAAPFAGRFRPEQALSARDATAANGLWKLRITDDAGGDVGILQSWSLDVVGTTCEADQPTVVDTVSVDDVSLAEGDVGTAALVFTATRTGAGDGVASVQFATADNTATVADSDYDAASGSITWADGETGAKTATVLINGDTTGEADETLFLDLSSPTNLTITDGQGMGTIQNDDLDVISVGDTSISEGATGTNPVLSIPVTRTGSGIGVASVQVDTADDTATTADADYVAATGTVSFADGETGTKDFSITLNGDSTQEADETVNAVLSNPTNATLGDGTGAGTILNDDAVPTVTIAGGSGPESTNGAFQVTLSNPSAFSTSVIVSTFNGTAKQPADYTLKNVTVNFAPGATSTVVPVAVNNDAVDEPDERFWMKLTSPAGLVIGGTGQANWVIQDNDPPPSLSINDVTIVEGNSGTKNLVFTIKLNKVSGKTVSVKYATAAGSAKAGSDYVAKSGTVTFSPGQLTKTVAVAIKGDTIKEAAESFHLLLSAAVNASIADAAGIGGILDND